MQTENFFTYEEALKASTEYFNGSEISARIFLDKYALRDNEGRILEKTPDALHRRLAKEFARIEKNKFSNPLTEDYIYEHLKNFSCIIAQGSPMYGIGNDYQTVSLSNCVHGEAMVYTQEHGLIKMKDVRAGDHVLTHKNRFKKVLNHWSNGFKDTITIIRSFTNKRSSVKNEQEMSRFLAVTPDHKLYNESGDWIEAKNFINKQNKKLKEPILEYTGKVPDFLPLNMGRNLEITKELMWMFGMYLAEGSIKKRNTNHPSMYFTLSSEESAYADKINKFSKENLGNDCWVQTWDDYNFIQVNIFDSNFSDLVKNIFGYGFKNKRIPSWIFGLDKNLKESLIDGFLCGDGTNYEGLEDNSYLFSIANPTLAYEIGLLARSCGKCSRFNFLCKGKLIKNRTITTSISSTNETKIYCVQSPMKVEVFDMEVEEDHSFVAGDVICHNCFVIPSVEDSYGGICKYDEQLAQISKRRGGVGGDVAKLRPVGARTKNAARSSTGKVQFMSRFSNTIREVGQNGRRGAEMITTSIHHPETVFVWDEETMGKPYKTIVDTEDDFGNPIKFETTSDKFDPNNIDFVTCKYDKTKVTGANISIRLSDEFLSALERGEKFQQRWPVDKEEFERRKANGEEVFEKWVSAKVAWDKIITSAWQMAEPGLLFWDNIIRESPADCYSDYGYKTISTNPCLTGETLVYVADGRGDVPIKQLADEGKDVDVFCFDDNGKLVIRRMRHPRITGYNEKIYKVTLDDGSTIRTTSNHKFRLRDGSYEEVRNLKKGDSLKLLTKYEASIKEIFKGANSNSQDYIWLNYGFKNAKSEHRIIAEHNFGKIKNGYVVHHKDYNAKNNSPENLQIMKRKDHDHLHSKDMIGDKNPMRRAQKEWSKEKWEEYSRNMSESVSRDKNGKYSGYTINQIKTHAIQLTKNLGRRFSQKDWIKYAKEKGLPQSFSSWRRGSFNSPLDLSRWCAIECGIENIDTDPRLVKTLQKAISEGYNAKIFGNKILVIKKCEHCGSDFETPYFEREICFCSRACSNHYLNARGTNKKRTNSINKTYYKKGEETKEKQVEIYSKLKFELGREPKVKEWESACRESGVSFRLKTKYGFQNYQEIKESSLAFNHKVVSVEFDGYEDVYNGTVDDFHNFFVGGFESKTKSGKRKSSYINNLQCGEITLSGYDSCRLMVLNLFYFVKKPWTSEAYFDYNLFYQKAKLLQRLMDDLVDLEEEAINKIINKVKNDPESIDIKRNEIELWENILEACKNGRRTGSGILALGDAIAALGVGYGTEEGIEIVDNIYKTLKFGCYASSVEMSKEIGPFPVWNAELEKENPFLNRIRNEEITLSSGPKLEGCCDESMAGEVIYNDMKKYGRRNIALLTTAPTGSISMLAKLTNKFGTSSGIEPEFDDQPYTRKKKGNPGDENFRSDSVDQNGDHWMHFEIFSPAMQDWMECTGETDWKKNPFHGHTANSLNWKNRVRLQATAQKHIDHSISSTVNLPADVSVEKVKEIYETAWKEGCKGITIYRDGCRSGVLVRSTPSQSSNQKIQKTHAPKRPKEVIHEVHHCTRKGHRYVVSVGFLQGDPLEVFINSNHDNDGEIIIPKSVKEGIVIKEARGKYILKTENSRGEIINYPLSNGQCDTEMESIARLTSSNLRHGTDIAFVVHTLEKIPGDMQSPSKIVARVLKKYIEDGFQVTGEECPGCKESTLIRQDGCIMCKNCSWTKCS